MTAWPSQPIIHEINTWVRLGELSRKRYRGLHHIVTRPADLPRRSGLRRDGTGSGGNTGMRFGKAQSSPRLSRRRTAPVQAQRLPIQPECLNIRTCCWAEDGERPLVIINFRRETSQRRVRVPWDERCRKTWRLANVLARDACDRSRDEMGHWSFRRLRAVAMPRVSGAGVVRPLLCRSRQHRVRWPFEKQKEMP
jgi:hypothetical protein